MARAVTVLGHDDCDFAVERVELEAGWVLLSLDDREHPLYGTAFVQQVVPCYQEPAYMEDPDPLADLHWDEAPGPTYH